MWEMSNDVSTGSVTTKYTYAGNEFSANSLSTVCPEWNRIEKTFAAGRYITIDVTSTGDSLTAYSVVIENPT